jgi:hypothetical protein
VKEQIGTEKGLLAMAGRELAYKRKARLRGKNRKLRIELVYEMDNLVEADRKARKGKGGHRGVRFFDRHRDKHLNQLHDDLQNGTYHTSDGTDVEQLCPCGKVRLLHKLPYYPDHIENHALMQVIMPAMERHYYYDSSASIEGKGMHFAKRRTEKWIDKHKKKGRLYYAKLDFVKFYHNIDQRKCYERIARKFGNKGMRYLLHEIIFACRQGLGIGLYPIQPIANFYTCDICRLVMMLFDVFLEIYCDDIVILSESKKEVWKAVNFIMKYAEEVMNQPLHTNIGVQIIDEHHCLDFVGYQFFFNHTLLRKRMKQKFKQRMHRHENPEHHYRSAVSYRGWLMHCNGYHLWCKTMKMKSFKDIQVPAYERRDANGKRIIEGVKTGIGMIADQPLDFLDVELDVKSKFGKPAAWVQVRSEQGKLYKFITSSPRLIQIFQYVNTHDELPFRGRIINRNASGYPDYDITD